MKGVHLKNEENQEFNAFCQLLVVSCSRSGLGKYQMFPMKAEAIPRGLDNLEYDSLWNLIAREHPNFEESQELDAFCKL